ncbi:Hypothetical_protein [Hexamita inflata]|uniref:Hypothetical_protein n=1 Tax=Hexamita inflata TaxID=28002 RepID=A0AA86RMN4_9EUKA|nr:Hypothetical protein HINF_LOCUS64028 [Hexamita inflata]
MEVEDILQNAQAVTQVISQKPKMRRVRKQIHQSNDDQSSAYQITTPVIVQQAQNSIDLITQQRLENFANLVQLKQLTSANTQNETNAYNTTQLLKGLKQRQLSSKQLMQKQQKQEDVDCITIIQKVFRMF